MLELIRKKSWIRGIAAVILCTVIILAGMTLNKILKSDNSPNINISAELRELTEDEYKEVGVKGLENPSINDFRKLVIKAEIINAKNVSNKVLSIPHYDTLKQYINKNEDRTWFGNEYDQNNTNEKFARSERSITVYYKGLSENEFRERLMTLKIQVGWTAKDGKIIHNEYSLGEILTIKDRK